MKRIAFTTVVVLCLLLSFNANAGQLFNYPGISIGMDKEEFINYFKDRAIHFEYNPYTSDDGLVSTDLVDSFGYPAYIEASFSHKKVLIHLDINYIFYDAYSVGEIFFQNAVEVFSDLSSKLEEMYGTMMGGQFIADDIEYNYPRDDSYDIFTKALMASRACSFRLFNENMCLTLLRSTNDNDARIIIFLTYYSNYLPRYMINPSFPANYIDFVLD